ncbi:MAP kinase-activating death domain protein-like isoform X2 [Ptychodera flava]|uniref:MAP kinase-activating death domain protein-like isoform X2 n=1 Tax=Ptychodera flava TaxID=63121 RepID=UPI00396A94A6
MGEDKYAPNKEKKFFCPRLIDYLVIVGARYPNQNNNVAQTPDMLRRYPMEDHQDFPLPPDVIFFCQPEGCISVGQRRMSLRENTSFTFTLTEKDTGKVRYGVCVNFYRPFEKKMSEHRSKEKKTNHNENQKAYEQTSLSVPSPDHEGEKSPRTKRRMKTAKRVRNNSLTSLCIISHHPFFGAFRECLFILKKMIDACSERTRRKVGSKNARDSVWGVLTGVCENPGIVRHDVREIETWILRLLSAPVPVPGKTRIELEILPTHMHSPLTLALPDHTRFSMADFPLHLPLELLGVETCLQVLTCILQEHKVVLQSRDYNALSMSVMAFVSMIYPLEYMFPVIPLLPTCMSSAEQLLLAPTPYIIGVPASFFPYKSQFRMPDDVWLIDLDSNKITVPLSADELPTLPEPEGTVLKNHLKQALASMSMSPQAINNLDKADGNAKPAWTRRESFTSEVGFNPFIYGNDVDSVDIATRVAMVKFFNSPNIMANFVEHTRTLRLHPRPVVAFQMNQFLQSRAHRSQFIDRLSKTQAVEFFAEWSLNPTNVAFLRVHTGVYDPQLIGDKPKWYCAQLSPVEFKVYDEKLTLAATLAESIEGTSDDENPTDESGSNTEEEDDAGSTSSSYSSLSDFVTDIMNSDITGDVTGEFESIPPVDLEHHSVYAPPHDLQIPASAMSNSDSTFSIPDSESSASSYPSLGHDLDSEFGPGGSSTPPLYQRSVLKADTPLSPEHPPEVTLSGADTDADVESLKYDSDSNYSGTTANTVEYLGTPTTGKYSVDHDNNSIQSDPGFTESMHDKRRVPENGAVGNPGRSRQSDEEEQKTSSNVLRKLSSILRSESTESSPSTTPKKKPPLLKGLSDSRSIERDPMGSPTSIASSDFNGYPPSIKSDPGNYRSSSGVSSMSLPIGRKKKHLSPFPSGSRKTSLVERSTLIKHSVTGKKTPEKEKASPTSPPEVLANQENQQFLKEVIRNVMEGNGVGWLSLPRLKKLMQNENLRAQVVSQLYPQDSTVTEDYIEDVKITKQVYKGLISVIKALIAGLEHTYETSGSGGMASAFTVLEIAHTHYYGKEIDKSHSQKKGALTPDDESMLCSPEGWTAKEKETSVKKEHTDKIEDNRNDSSFDIVDESEIETLGNGSPSQGATGGVPASGTPDQDDDNGIEIVAKETNGVPGNSSSPDAPLKKNKQLEKISSLDSEASEASTLVSNSSDTLGNDSDISNNSSDSKTKKKSRINHHSIRTTMSDSEIELNGPAQYARRKRLPSVWSAKSRVSAGFRYHAGNMIATDMATSPEAVPRQYIFEGLIGKDKSSLWNKMQFWEDTFLDAVSAERDAVGMDQGPAEMMSRYFGLGYLEQRRLEEDEDKLLSTMLHNMIAYMVMMKVPKPEVKKKIRRLLGKSHIGLAQSQEVNELLDEINNLHGNDIDLKPSVSRQMRKHSFVVHAGTDTRGDVLFMEVCDDAIIIRSGNGAVCDRCWYEKLINMTYCPKTKVLCLWRKVAQETRLDKFYTKKCRELYYCVKESMEKAALRQNGLAGGNELGGEFPIQDVKTGEGGLLQVTLEGIGLKFAHTKQFIELKDIKKCHTKKDVFIIHEYNSQSKEVIKRRYKSSMANEICYAVLCVFSYVAAARSAENNRKEMEAKMALKRNEYLQDN